MKYFVYSYLWKRPGYDFTNSGTGLFKGHSIIDLYEHNIGQPEEWVVTHCQEITGAEYNQAEKNGIIG